LEPRRMLEGRCFDGQEHKEHPWGKHPPLTVIFDWHVCSSIVFPNFDWTYPPSIHLSNDQIYKSVVHEEHTHGSAWFVWWRVCSCCVWEARPLSMLPAEPTTPHFNVACGRNVQHLNDVPPLPPSLVEYDMFINDPRISSFSQILNLIFSFMLMRLPTLYMRSHKFPWYFCDFIRFSNRHWNSRLKPHFASAAQPCHLMSASCPPHTASHWVRICTASDHRHDHSMEHTRSCNMFGSLLMILQHCLLIESSPASHMSI
jgi:hypothetical protein